MTETGNTDGEATGWENFRTLLFWAALALMVIGVGVGLWRGQVFFFGLPGAGDGAKTEHAQFGDFISGVAGGLGLLGMVLALLLQTRELGLQRKELKTTQTEIKSQTDQFKAQAAIMDEQVKVTAAQNALIERQIMLTHQPLLRMYWESVENGAALVIENKGHGRALLVNLQFTAPNWGSESVGSFCQQLEAHDHLNPITAVPGEIDVGTLVEAKSRAEMLRVSGGKNVERNYVGFSAQVSWIPAQGGQESRHMGVAVSMSALV